jgi:hypothetical protein
MFESGKRNRTHTAPFLTQQDRLDTPPMGYLHIGMKYKLEIGIIDTPEYKLVQCLFSPANFPSARYESVGQTRERITNAMGKIPPSLFSTKKSSYIERSIKNLSRKEIGKFLTFFLDENTVRMSVRI